LLLGADIVINHSWHWRTLVHICLHVVGDTFTT